MAAHNVFFLLRRYVPTQTRTLSRAKGFTCA